MAITVVTPENLEYFKGKQDDFNDGRFIKSVELPTKVSDLENDAGYQTASDLQSAINAAVAAVLRYKGTKADVESLPATGNAVGDVWHVESNTAEYAWNGTEWEPLGGSIQASVSWSDIAGKPVEFPPEPHEHDAATQDAAGFMSQSDKIKLDGIASGANAYVHPSGTQVSSGLYKIATDGGGHVKGAVQVVKADITGLGIPAQDTTYGAATTTSAGLMSAADKSKLNGLEAIQGMTTAEIDELFS